MAWWGGQADAVRESSAWSWGGAQGDQVTVVNADGSIAPRTVKVGPMRGQNWVILEGLQAGEQVMVDGFMKLMPGVSRVEAVPFDASTPQAAPKPADAK